MAGDCDDLETNHAVFRAHHRERLLALLRMVGQCAVREPEAIMRIHDIDDAADNLDKADGQRRGHRDDDADCWFPTRLDDQAGPLVNSPMA